MFGLSYQDESVMRQLPTGSSSNLLHSERDRYRHERLLQFTIKSYQYIPLNERVHPDPLQRVQPSDSEMRRTTCPNSRRQFISLSRYYAYFDYNNSIINNTDRYIYVYISKTRCRDVHYQVHSWDGLVRSMVI